VARGARGRRGQAGADGEPGFWRGERIGSGAAYWKLSDLARLGELSEEEYLEAEVAVNRSHGTCMDMGTASTIASVCEALGVTLPGCAAIPAVDVRRSVLAERSGRRAVELACEGLRPSSFVTRESFENAIRVLEAIGGSTKAIIHLIALAGRLGIGLALSDFDDAAGTPVLVNVEPTGSFLMEDFFQAGGVPALLHELLPILHGEAQTANGRTLAENATSRPASSDVIRPLDDPLQAQGAHGILWGSLAPTGAVVKRSAASPGLLRHRGPAIVFEDVYDLKERIDAPDLDVSEDSVLVLKNGGPKGAPGFPELGTIPIPAKLLRKGVSDLVRISDSRISGTSFGTLVVHVAPEAAAGGPIGLVRDGDPIVLDVFESRLDLEVDERELARRREDFRPPAPQYRRGYGALYLEHVLQAPEGADFDFLRNPDGERPSLEPLLLMRGWTSL
jgi:dihydroxyacid dehydratase/phosphogluconate dehydratase